MLGSASIFNDINAGFWDDGLNAIIEAAVARRKFVNDMRGAENQVTFQHGDHVRIINIKPKYLHGITGTVNKERMPSRRGDIMVNVDPSMVYRLGRYGSVLAVPASSLERV